MNSLEGVNEEQKDNDDCVNQVGADYFDNATALVEISDDGIDHVECEGSKKDKASYVGQLPEGEGRPSWKRVMG